MSENLKNKVTTETEIGSNGVGHSNMSSEVGETTVSSAELKYVLEKQQETIARLTAELDKAQRASIEGNSIDKLTAALTDLITKTNTPTQVGPMETDNITRTENFRNSMAIDGAAMMQAQETCNAFRNEPKRMISIPKSFKDRVGPTLDVSVNGVRVSIPVDGKSYPINASHYMAARERIAKIDRLLADDTPDVREIG